MSKLKIFLILLMTLIVALVLVSFASAEVIANLSSGDNGQSGIGNTTFLGQNFTTPISKNFSLESAGFKMFRIGTVNEIRLTLRPLNTSGFPNATILSSGNISGSSIVTSTPGNFSYATMSAFTLEAGVSYVLVVNFSGSGSLFPRSASPSIVPDGMLFQSADGISFTRFDTDDLLFEVNSTGVASVSVDLVSPPNGFATSSSSFVFNATISPILANLTNATLFLYFSNGSLLNTTSINVTGNVMNTSSIAVNNVSAGSYIWQYRGCGLNATGGQTLCGFSSNFTFVRQSFTVLQQSFDGNVFETENITFKANFSISNSTTVFAGTLNYNGTSFAATVNNLGNGVVQLVRRIDIPTVTQNTTKNLNWTLVFSEGGIFTVESTTSITQNVTLTNITDRQGSFVTLNYTVYDEDTRLPISAFFKATYTWFLGEGSTFKNVSYNLTSNTTFRFFNIPQQRLFYQDAAINIKNDTGIILYGERNYDFNLVQLTNVTTEQKLFLLNVTRSRNIIIEVNDEALKPLKDFYVTIKRYYIEDDKYLVVENRRTDSSGKFTAKLVEDEVVYTLEFRDINNTLLKTVERQIFSCQTSICSKSFVIVDTNNPLARFSNLSNYETTLTFSNSSNIFTATWNDGRNENARHRLLVQRILFNGTSIVCNSTSTAGQDQGILTCSVGNQKASYTAQLFRSVDGKERRIRVETVKVGSEYGKFGLEGLMWSFILLFTLIGLALFSPALAIVVYLVGFIGLAIMDIIYVSPAIIIAQLIIGIVFAWALKT